MSSILSRRLISAATIALLGAALPAAPVHAADFVKFHAACLSHKSAAFLLGPETSKEQAALVLGVLCPCLEDAFKTLDQPAVDALEADLRTGNSDEAKSKYRDYATLRETATGVLGVCFAKDEVTKALMAPASSAPKN
jgi:hypothetical protein